MQRYFALDDKLNIKDSDKHHIINVMRMRKGDNVEIVFNEEVFLCVIKEINKKSVEIEKIKKLHIDNELEKKITIAIPLLTEKKIDFILQKCTELGVYDFVFIDTERSKIKLDGKIDKKIERWETISKEAAEQSYRNIIPKINGLYSITDIINMDYDLKLVCSTKESEKTIKNVLQNSTNYDRIIIVVGPEGGITDKEEEILNKNEFISVTLGKTILRAETAPMFVMSAVKYEMMR